MAAISRFVTEPRNPLRLVPALAMFDAEGNEGRPFATAA